MLNIVVTWRPRRRTLWAPPGNRGPLSPSLYTFHIIIIGSFMATFRLCGSPDIQMMVFAEDQLCVAAMQLNPQWEIQIKAFTSFIISNEKINHLDSESLKDSNHQHEISLYWILFGFLYSLYHVQKPSLWVVGPMNLLWKASAMTSQKRPTYRS